MRGRHITGRLWKILLLVATTGLLIGGLVGAAGAAAEKIELCHEPGTPDEATLQVAENAVGSHINHGDVVGSCEDLPEPPAPPLLGEVLDRGFLRCGVNAGDVPGFSVYNTGTETHDGLEPDLCRALAAAIFASTDAIEFVPLSSAERFDAVRDGDVDVLFRITTDTLRRDATAGNGGVGVNFAPTYFYNGDAFLSTVPIDDFVDLDGLSVCVTQGTVTEAALDDLVSSLGITIEKNVYANVGDATDAFVEGDCDALAADLIYLAAVNVTNGANGWTISDIFTKEPLAPMVREGDDEWMAVVRWVVFAAFDAEERGVTSANVGSTTFGADTAALGAFLGLGTDWAFDAVDQVGNYGEIYDAHLTPIGLPRGRNASHLDGGLLYSPPLR